MRDLGMVRELGDLTPLLEPHELAPARDRLLAAVTAEAVADTRTVGPVATTGPRRRRPAWRFAFAGWATAGLAAAVTAVVVLVPGAGADRPSGGGAVITPGGSAPAPDGAARPAPAMLPAAQVLENASSAARSAPDVKPRADQFIYSRSTYTDEGHRIVTESWISVDGTRDGLDLRDDPRGDARYPQPGCRGGRAAVVRDGRVVPGRFEACRASPGYLVDLPTDRDALLAYLKKKNGDGRPGGLARFMLSISGGYLRPAQRAAVYAAMAQLAASTPAVTVVPDAVDGAGRRGVGIRWNGSPEPAMLILDPTTYEFIAFGARDGWRKGFAIVDKAGQRP